MNATFRSHGARRGWFSVIVLVGLAGALTYQALSSGPVPAEARVPFAATLVTAWAVVLAIAVRWGLLVRCHTRISAGRVEVTWRTVATTVRRTYRPEEVAEASVEEGEGGDERVPTYRGEAPTSDGRMIILLDSDLPMACHLEVERFNAALRKAASGKGVTHPMNRP